jgi:hypothetical protein
MADQELKQALGHDEARRKAERLSQVLEGTGASYSARRKASAEVDRMEWRAAFASDAQAALLVSGAHGALRPEEVARLAVQHADALLLELEDDG